MTNTNKLNEIKETLEGMEIQSIQFEGIVTINNGKIEYYRGDKLISTNGTSAQWQVLLNEAFENEFPSNWENDLIEEMKLYK